MDISELIESIDILEYISQFADFTEKNGEYWALSPLKDENTPSFSVRKEENSFYDFSSGIGGNVLTFTRHYFNCTNSEAIEKLKEYAGYDGDVKARKRLSATEVAKRFSSKAKTKKNGKMNTLPEKYMERFQKRYDKLAVWEDEGILRESLDKFQVRYDAFSDRLVYPIRNLDGEIVNVGGRILTDGWKEKGYRKYTYFKSWDNGMQVIYGIFENMEAIKESRQVILFEGAKSVMLADTYGVKNTGAILTSHLNPYQMKILIGIGCDVIFALDKDVSVKEDHNIKKLKQYLNVYYLWDKENILGQKDAPVDKGEEVFRKLLDERRRFL